MDKRFSILGFSVGLFLIVFTSYNFLLEVPYSAKRLAEGILLVAGVLIVCSSKVLQQQWFKTVKLLDNSKQLLFISLSVFGIMGFISALFAESWHFAFLELVHYFLLFNFTILCVIIYSYKSSWFEVGFLSVVGLMAGLYLLNVTISYLYTFFIPDFPTWPGTDFVRIWFEGKGFRYPEPFLNFVNYRFFNHLQTWSLPLLTLLVIQIPKRYWAFSKVAFMIACGWWMLVFAADARGTMFASFVALGFIFIMYRKKAPQWIHTHSLTIIVGLALYFVFFKLFQSGEKTILTRYSDNGRFELWEYALNIFLENPLLGVGPMHYAKFNTEVNYSAPHNIYLQFFSEWGLIAGISLLVIIGIGCYKWFIQSKEVVFSSASNSSEANIRIALTASIMAGLIHGLFSGIMNTPLSQVLMILVLAWMIGISLSNKGIETESKPLNSYFRYGLICINLLAAGFLVWSFVVQIPSLEENRLQYLKETKRNKLYPRYWDQGVIGLDESKVEEVGNLDGNVGQEVQ